MSVCSVLALEGGLMIAAGFLLCAAAFRLVTAFVGGYAVEEREPTPELCCSAGRAHTKQSLDELVVSASSRARRCFRRRRSAVRRAAAFPRLVVGFAAELWPVLLSVESLPLEDDESPKWSFFSSPSEVSLMLFVEETSLWSLADGRRLKRASARAALDSDRSPLLSLPLSLLLSLSLPLVALTVAGSRQAGGLVPDFCVVPGTCWNTIESEDYARPKSLGRDS